MNKGILVVYNICTINRDNIDKSLATSWISDIQSIFDQDFKDYHLIVSECRGSNKDSLKSDLLLNDFIKDMIDNDSSYNVIYEHLPIHSTFNYSVMEAVKKFGKFEYYMYVTSGISFREVFPTENSLIFKEILKNVYNFLKDNNDIARVNLPIYDNDNCFPPHSAHYLDTLVKEPYYMKPGYRINDHCSIYSNDLYEAYDGRLRPDLYIGNGAEPTFSYLTGVIGKKNAIPPFYVCPMLAHNKRQDGGDNPGIKNDKWFLKYDTIEEVTAFRKRLERHGIIIDYGHTCGARPGVHEKHRSGTNEFLTETNKGILEENFGDDGVTMNESDRKSIFKFLKEEFFVSKDIIDYDNIKSKYYV